MSKGKIQYICLLFLTVIFFVSCSTEGFSITGKPEFSDPSYQRIPPEVLMPLVSEGPKQNHDDGARSGTIDVGNAVKGYVGVTCVSPTRARFSVEKGTAGASDYSVYNYELMNDGSQVFFPLAMGDGHYKFTIFLNIQGNEYEYFLTAETDVVLENPFVPFLVPNEIVNYTPESNLVAFTHSITANASSDLEVVQQVYYWVQNNITYDTGKVSILNSGEPYVPNIDEILASKTGICYDYAALVAGMLRSNGIPCQLIMGNVKTPNDGTVYHAWNMIYLEGKGWIAVKVPSTPDEWKRIDLTFAASGDSSISKFIGDGENYFEMSVH